jgi:hypothetical protein
VVRKGLCGHSKFFFAVGLGENVDKEILNDLVEGVIEGFPHKTAVVNRQTELDFTVSPSA